MERFKRFSLVALSLMLVFTLVTVLGTKQVHALVASMVQVVNNTSNPVPNRDVDNAARQPYTFICNMDIAPKTQNHDCSTSVPSGKRLVIENFKGAATIPTGQKFIARLVVFSPAGLAPGSDAPPDYASFHAELQMSNGVFDHYTMNENLRSYVDSGCCIVISFFRNSGNLSSSSSVTITGYLVSL